jgi:hypothetical protein
MGDRNNLIWIGAMLSGAFVLYWFWMSSTPTRHAAHGPITVVIPHSVACTPPQSAPSPFAFEYSVVCRASPTALAPFVLPFLTALP